MAGCIAGCQYIPSVEFFAHWHYHGQMLIEAHEHLQKRTWRNKTAIQGSETALILTVPLKKGKHHQKLITEVEIAYDEAWYRIHFNSISSAYGKTTFFSEVEEDIKELLYSHQNKLWELNVAFLEYLAGIIPGSWTFKFTDDYVSDYPEDIIDLRHGIPGGTTQLPLEKIPKYDQIQRLGKMHIPNLSILDVLCHLGPGTKDYIVRYANQLYQ